MRKFILISLLSVFCFADCKLAVSETRKTLTLMALATDDGDDNALRMFYDQYKYWSRLVIADCQDFPNIVEFMTNSRKNIKKLTEQEGILDGK